MKNLFVTIFVLFSISINAQDITNTLASGGTFKVNDNASTTLLTLPESGNATLKGSLTLTNGSDSYTLPNTDGSSDQVLKTDGNGNLSWTNNSAVNTQSVKFLICVSGVYPTSSGSVAEFFLGQIVISAGPNANHVPSNFMECKGQVLLTSEYPALFSVLGTTYGGNGTTTFALPNLTSIALIGQ